MHSGCVKGVLRVHLGSSEGHSSTVEKCRCHQAREEVAASVSGYTGTLEQTVRVVGKPTSVRGTRWSSARAQI
jgi:hypothetical protein